MQRNNLFKTYSNQSFSRFCKFIALLRFGSRRTCQMSRDQATQNSVDTQGTEESSHTNTTDTQTPTDFTPINTPPDVLTPRYESKTEKKPDKDDEQVQESTVLSLREQRADKAATRSVERAEIRVDEVATHSDDVSSRKAGSDAHHSAAAASVYSPQIQAPKPFEQLSLSTRAQQKHKHAKPMSVSKKKPLHLKAKSPHPAKPPRVIHSPSGRSTRARNASTRRVSKAFIESEKTSHLPSFEPLKDETLCISIQEERSSSSVERVIKSPSRSRSRTKTESPHLHEHSPLRTSGSSSGQRKKSEDSPTRFEKVDVPTKPAVIPTSTRWESKQQINLDRTKPLGATSDNGRDDSSSRKLRKTRKRHPAAQSSGSQRNHRPSVRTSRTATARSSNTRYHASSDKEKSAR